MEDDAPQALVLNAEEARCHGDRHVHGERHGHPLEQQREAGAGSRPRDGDEAHAALGAFDARRSGGQEGLMLEEVEVAPGLLDGVVHRAPCGLALGAVEAGAGLEVESDVEALVGSVEVGRGDEPRRGDAEGELEEVIVAHAAPGSWVDPGSQCAAVPCGYQGQALRVALKRAILDGRRPVGAILRHQDQAALRPLRRPQPTHSVRRGGSKPQWQSGSSGRVDSTPVWRQRRRLRCERVASEQVPRENRALRRLRPSVGNQDPT